MSTTQWVIMYLCIAALVAGAAIAFAAWSRGHGPSTPQISFGPALVAGAVWPLLLVGAVQWLLVHVLATILRPQAERTSAAEFYGPAQSTSRHRVSAS